MTNHDELRYKSETPRVDALIQRYKEKHPSITTKGHADYYEDMHQGLAPLARKLEKELDATDVQILALLAENKELGESLAEECGLRVHDGKVMDKLRAEIKEKDKKIARLNNRVLALLDENECIKQRMFEGRAL